MHANKATSCAIRIAVKGDVAAMVSVINAAFGIEGFLEGERTNRVQLAEMMTRGIFLLGHDSSGALIASVYVEIRDSRGYFGMLAVDPIHQHKGIGRAMVEAAEDHCRKQGCTDMDLTVLSLRTELPALYRKLGYAQTGTEEFRPSRPLKDGLQCHCIVMSKKL